MAEVAVVTEVAVVAELSVAAVDLTDMALSSRLLPDPDGGSRRRA
ncbi:hypothetical protein [Streptomyces sp. NPDC048638]